MSALTIDIPDTLTDELRALAAKEGVSLQEYIARSVAQQVAAAKDLEYLRARAARGRVEDFWAVMDAVPDVPPMPGDELPPEELAYWRAALAQGRPPPASSEP